MAEPKEHFELFMPEFDTWKETIRQLVSRLNEVLVHMNEDFNIVPQTLTDKIIDADDNTISNLEHGSEVDNPSSAVHGVTGTIVGTSDTQTLTNKTLTSPVINTSVSGTAFLDEDDMASNSSTKFCSQQSIKAYVNAHDVFYEDAGSGGNPNNYYAGNSAAPGSYSNVCIGWFSGKLLSTGSANTLVGTDTGESGNLNGMCAFGASAGEDSTVGYCSFFGTSAGNFNTTPTDNSYFGYTAGAWQTTGTGNSGFGFEALRGAYDAGGRVFSKNSGFGYSVGAVLTTGSEGSYFGYNAGSAVNTGTGNTLLGYQAGDNITSGGYNIIIGHNIDPASATGSNQFMLGNATYPFLKGDMANYQLAINGANGYLNFSTTLGSSGYGIRDNGGTMEYKDSGGSWTTFVSLSDERLKENIAPDPLGLDFILKLNPITFNFKEERSNGRENGLIAQRVKEALDDLDATFSGWQERPDGLQILKYDRFILPLINAVKMQQHQIEVLKQQLWLLKYKIKDMMTSSE